MKEIIKGWIARDEMGEICHYVRKPQRMYYGDEADKIGVWEAGDSFILFYQDLFPYITWKDEPRKVTITIEVEEE